MSALDLHSIPGVQGVSKTVSGLGNLSPNILNPGSAKTEQGADLLSSFSVATSKGGSTIWDKVLGIIFSILSFFFFILRKVTPSSIRNFLIFFIPPILAFYELAFRVYFPKLPSLFVIAFKLHQRGHLTINTVIWLASSLPGDFLGGLGALGGVATHATAALVGGVATAGNALAGTATHIVGDAANTLSHLSHGLHVPAPATSIASFGVNGAASLAGGTTQVVAGGLSLVTDSHTAVAENLAHLVSGEHAIPTGGLFPHVGQGQGAIQGAVGNANAITAAVIGATQGTATENATKLVQALDPLHIVSKGSQNSQVISAAGYASANTGAAVQQAATPLAVIQATQAAAAENVTKVLESVNPLHLNLAPKGSQASQAPSNPIGGLLQPKIPGLRS